MVKANETLAQRAHRQFFHALLNNSLRDLADALYDILECPVQINDSYAKNLVMAPCSPIGDADWDYHLSANETSIDHFQDFYAKYANLESYRYPILVEDGKRVKTRQLLSHLTWNGRFVGSTVILVFDKDVTDEMISIVKMFNSAVINELRRLECTNKEFQLLDSEKLYTAITCQNNGSEELTDIYRSLSLRFHPNYIITAIKMVHAHTSPEVMSRIARDITLTASTSIAAVHGNIIYVLHSFIDDLHDPDCKPFLKQLLFTDRLSEYKYDANAFCTGISESFNHIDEISLYAEQAKLTLQVGMCVHPQKKCYYNNDYSPLQLYAAAIEKHPIEIFCPQIIRRIYRYDCSHTTDFLKTLETYFYYRMNAKETALAMSVHVNTLRHRLERISELFDYDFENVQLYHSINSFFFALNTGAFTMEQVIR